MFFEVKSKHEVKQYSPGALAFVGDAFYELYVRERLVGDGSLPVGMLHKRAVQYVCARAQSAAVHVILPMLSEEEEAIFRRGRNASSLSVPRHVPTADYRRATGLECLFGFLCMSGEENRASDLLRAAWDAIEQSIRADEAERQDLLKTAEEESDSAM